MENARSGGFPPEARGGASYQILSPHSNLICTKITCSQPLESLMKGMKVGVGILHPEGTTSA